MIDAPEFLRTRVWHPNASLYYPCAGQDWKEVLALFGPWMQSLRFCDLKYQFDAGWSSSWPEDWALAGGAWRVTGPMVSQVRRLHFFRHVDPAMLRGAVRHVSTGRVVDLRFRRGFGQQGLHEIPDGTLDVFLHRGDGIGEGGSDVWFLANRPAAHAPLARLLDVIARKLRYPGLIGSDGSNTDIRQLRQAAYNDPNAPTRFNAQGLSWRRVGDVPFRGHLTVFWEVVPKPTTHAARSVTSG
jgi:hypothetical protein